MASVSFLNMAREEKPIRWKTLIVLLAIALGLGTSYRFIDLAKKPMHTDEAILAMKSQEYWQTGTFEYDPKDYHGPFLHHLTKWIGDVRGWHPDTLTEEHVRWVVALCGLLLVITPLLFLDVIGRTSAGVSALLLAASPMMTYYSRYYIMEVPFVLLTALFIATMWQWAKGKNKLWLVPAGVLLGLMHATKETFVLNVAALLAGVAVVKLMGLNFEINSRSYGFRSFTKKPKPWWAWVVFIAAAAFSSVWMFSNGFKDWQYVTESVTTYQSYLGRSQGAGGHEKPWDYYLSLLFWRKQGFQWSEALIGGLAIVGMLNAFLDRRRADHKRAFLVCFSTYTLVLLVIYCLIPYKTPWSVLAVSYAFAVLAGLGARTIFRVFTEVPIIKIALALFLAGGIYNLCQQTSRATDFTQPHKTVYAVSDLRNPYSYSHTSTSLVELADYIHQLAGKHAAGKSMPVQIIQGESGWPLPWYLRDMTHVGYQTTAPKKLDAPVILVDANRVREVSDRLKSDYESSFWRLRTNVALVLLVEKSLTNRHADAATSLATAPATPPAPAPPAAPPLPTVPPAPDAPPPVTIGTPTPGMAAATAEAGAPSVPAPTPSLTAASSPDAPPVPVPTAPPAMDAGGLPIPPKAQLVEDDPPPLVGPPFPVPAPAAAPAPVGTPLPAPEATTPPAPASVPPAPAPDSRDAPATPPLPPPPPVGTPVPAVPVPSSN